jgi:enamine deaminase RidA (YjgF/YER057c/UK114 family)
MQFKIFLRVALAAPQLRGARTGRGRHPGDAHPAHPPGAHPRRRQGWASTEMIIVSGQHASTVDPNKPMAEVKSVEETGDTKTQTIAALGKIKQILE